MWTVKNILNDKGYKVFSVEPDASAFEALQLMSEKNIGGVLVMEGPKLIGIFTERDYARKVVLMGKSSQDVEVRELMSSPVFTVLPSTTIEDCMHLMVNKRIRHLPVAEDEHVIGVLSIVDVVKFIITEQKFIIDNLEQYITGHK